jgi:HSP20 family protein
MAWRDYRDLLRQMEHDMQRLNEDTFFGFLDPPPGVNRFWQPAADVHETDTGVQIKMELAGVTTDGVHVALSADGRHLAVSGVRAEQQDERSARRGCHQLEIYFGPFERTFPIPADVEIDRDAISATLKDGFLTIHLPRRVRQPQVSRSIPIEREP